MDKTTLYLDPGDYRQLKRLAAGQKRAPAALVRDAVAEYIVRHSPARTLPESLGAGDSGRNDLGTQAESLLSGLGESHRAAPRRRRR
jgi:predicted transcriptional regulator